MSTATLRDRLKSSTFHSVYRVLRQWKRQMRGEPILPTPPALSVWPLETLESKADVLSGHSRYHYSIALALLESASEQTSSDTTKALATRALQSLEQASALHFEAVHRLSLYKADCLFRLGRIEEAQCLLTPLMPCELTKEENELRLRLLDSAA